MAKNRRIEIRLTEEEYKKLETRAKEQNWSISEMVRQECIENQNDNSDRLLYTKSVMEALDTINRSYFIAKEKIPCNYHAELKPIKKGVEDLWQSLR